MISTDLKNLATALEQVSKKDKDENRAFFEIFCCNLNSLAQRVYQLECMSVPLVQVTKKDMSGQVSTLIVQ